MDCVAAIRCRGADHPGSCIAAGGGADMKRNRDKISLWKRGPKAFYLSDEAIGSILDQAIIDHSRKHSDIIAEMPLMKLFKPKSETVRIVSRQLGFDVD